MIVMIAAAAENNALGKDNELLWHLPDDFKRFKQLTTGHPIIMGRKTFESLGKPLPNRTTIIISRNKDYRVEGCITVNSLEEAIKAAKEDSNPYILGGGEIYKQAMEYADMLDLTLVHHSFENADTFFPTIDPKIWQETNRRDFIADEHHKYDFSFVSYKKSESL